MERTRKQLAAPVSMVAIAVWLIGGSDVADAQQAQAVLDSSGVRGGLVVHVGCGDGKLTAAIGSKAGYLVQGLDTDPIKVQNARSHLRSLGVQGHVTVREFDGERLPYIDNSVNLVLSEDLKNVSAAEIERVLCPAGVAYFKTGDVWKKTVKQKPDDTDEWTHYLYDASNNAVSHDVVAGPPRRYQWIADPKWSRCHEHMSSMNALVSAGGKIFYVIDEGPRSSISLPPKWSLIARDAYNGVIIWKRSLPSWHDHLWPLKSGPAQLPRRLVAVGESVYIPLGIDAPLSALDANSGEILRTFDATEPTEEVIAADGVLFALVGDYSIQQQAYRHKTSHVWDAGDEAKARFAWAARDRALVAIEAQTGKLLWQQKTPVMPLTPAVDAKHVYFFDGGKVVALNRNDGTRAWTSEVLTTDPYELGIAITPTLVVYRGVVLFSGADEKMTALAADSGKTLWASEHAESGHHSPEDLLCVDGQVWDGAIARVRQQGGTFTGRDPLTGKITSQFSPDIDIHWFHHRCHRAKATDRYLIPSATGIEFVDFRTQHWEVNHWVRGACLYGIIPANGMIYVPPHPCACYIEAKLNGFNALAPAVEADAPTVTYRTPPAARFTKGPAFNQAVSAATTGEGDSWPTYRHDASRSGFTAAAVSSDMRRSWETSLGGKLSPPVVAAGKVFVASIDRHTVYAIDEQSGKTAWNYSAGGRIDSPPTISNGRVLFGSTDGHVYCLRADDGRLIWRYMAAPEDRQLVVRGQLESVWPVHGSVLVVNDIAYCLAGRSIFLDGGMRLIQLDTASGNVLGETVMGDRDPESGDDFHVRVKGLSMPAALSDILTSDGQNIYLRSQRIDLTGSRSFDDAAAKKAATPGQDAHLFVPAGFLDDSWFHRTYWMYGTESGSGWGGWSRPGLTMPIGRILSVGDSKVYGFGRKPAFICQSSMMEYQLYSANPRFNKEYLKSINRVTKESDRRIDDWQVNHRLPVEKLTVLDYNWREENLPLMVRAMVLAGSTDSQRSDGTLVIAGPPDVADEVATFSRFKDPAVFAQLAEQAAAFDGKRGGLLWAVSADDGKQLAEYELESPPVFDGMAVAGGRMFMTTMDGRIECWK